MLEVRHIILQILTWEREPYYVILGMTDNVNETKIDRGIWIYTLVYIQ